MVSLSVILVVVVALWNPWTPVQSLLAQQGLGDTQTESVAGESRESQR